jgi:SAM-dependent methyltransferase
MSMVNPRACSSFWANPVFLQGEAGPCKRCIRPEPQHYRHQLLDQIARLADPELPNPDAAPPPLALVEHLDRATVPSLYSKPLRGQISGAKNVPRCQLANTTVNDNGRKRGMSETADIIFSKMTMSGMLDWVGGGDPKIVGKINFDTIVQNIWMKPSFRVFDFGCGIGRTSVTLADYLISGELIGSDIVPAQIRFCKDEIESRLNNSQFYCLDAENPADTGGVGTYNELRKQSEGQAEVISESAFASKYKEYFDVGVAYSVFTHFTTSMASRYLVWLRDLIKEDGNLFLSFFLDHPSNPAPQRLVAEEGWKDSIEGVYLNMAVFDENLVAKLANDADFQVCKIVYGFWRTQSNHRLVGQHFQDVVVLRSTF